MILKFITLAVTSCLLSACSLLGQNIPHANIKVQSAQFLNPDINGNPSPVVVTIYELKSPFTFNHASYYDLMTNSAEVLRNDLIDQQIVEIRPNHSETFYQPLSINTHYLGIVAAYRNIEQDPWQGTIKVIDNHKNINIKLSLESQGLLVSTEQS